MVCFPEQAPKRGCHDITADVEAAVRDALGGVRAGVLNVFIQHTSASLTVADPEAAEPLEEALNAVVPERWNRDFFQHTYEVRGAQTTPAYASRLAIKLKHAFTPRAMAFTGRRRHAGPRQVLSDGRVAQRAGEGRETANGAESGALTV
jgi:hypothetical protein